MTDAAFPANIRFQSTLPMKGATPIKDPYLLTNLFQSTLPMKGATCHRDRGRGALRVSIHAPNEGSDDIHTLALIGT